MAFWRALPSWPSSMARSWSVRFICCTPSSAVTLAYAIRAEQSTLRLGRHIDDVCVNGLRVIDTDDIRKRRHALVGARPTQHDGLELLVRLCRHETQVRDHTARDQTTAMADATGLVVGRFASG